MARRPPLRRLFSKGHAPASFAAPGRDLGLGHRLAIAVDDAHGQLQHLLRGRRFGRPGRDSAIAGGLCPTVGDQRGRQGYRRPHDPVSLETHGSQLSRSSDHNEVGEPPRHGALTCLRAQRIPVVATGPLFYSRSRAWIKHAGGARRVAKEVPRRGVNLNLRSWVPLALPVPGPGIKVIQTTRGGGYTRKGTDRASGTRQAQ